MINDLLKALARGPLLMVDGWWTCAFCERQQEDWQDENLSHAPSCPVNQARELLAAGELAAEGLAERQLAKLSPV